MSYLNYYFPSKVHTACHSRHSCDPSYIKKSKKSISINCKMIVFIILWGLLSSDTSSQQFPLPDIILHVNQLHGLVIQPLQAFFCHWVVLLKKYYFYSKTIHFLSFPLHFYSVATPPGPLWVNQFINSLINNDLKVLKFINKDHNKCNWVMLFCSGMMITEHYRSPIMYSHVPLALSLCVTNVALKQHLATSSP